MSTAERLEALYQVLLDRFGPQHWWPGESPFEIMVGAVLTQNTNWQNVEKAIDNLKRAGRLTLEAMSSLPVGLLAEYIRPSGYYNIKAGRLQNLLQLINGKYGGDLEGFLARPLPDLRRELLSVNGIGPETADSIILYAAEQPIFVVDAYTHRILCRHDIVPEDYGYTEVQELFMDNLPEDVSLFNEFHALLVRLGKEFCRKSRPACKGCPLAGF